MHLVNTLYRVDINNCGIFPSNTTFHVSFKAYMNSDIPLETAAIFFFLANLYLNQGIGWVYAMVDFICMCLPNLWEA